MIFDIVFNEHYKRRFDVAMRESFSTGYQKCFLDFLNIINEIERSGEKLTLNAMLAKLNKLHEQEVQKVSEPVEEAKEEEAKKVTSSQPFEIVK